MKSPNYLVWLVTIVMSIPCLAQRRDGILKGRIFDGSTLQTCYGISVTVDSLSKGAMSMADGRYSLLVPTGTHTLYFRIDSLHTRVIKGVVIRADEINYLDVSLGRRWAVADRITEESIQPGTDRNLEQLLRRLNGVTLEDQAGTARQSSLRVFGLGERYNQVLLNGAVLSSFDPMGRAWAFGLFPIEAIETVSMGRTGNPAIPADYAGGSIAIRTKDLPDRNFVYLRAGGGFSDATNDKDFYSDKRAGWEWLGLPGSGRNLPGAFPTTRSSYSLDQKNPQEQVSLSRLLPNNFAPVNQGRAKPDDQVTVGLGRIIQLKKGEKIGIVAFVNHQGRSRIDAATVRGAPDLSAGLYPFSNPDKPLIRAMANDIHYRYEADLAATVNASIYFGKNKISWKNFISREFSNTYTQRSQVFKPDEDSLSHAGIHYRTEQRALVNTQLSGEHAFGEEGKFKMNWLASYTYQHRQNPDERNFLLRSDSIGGNTFEIARPQVAFNPADVNTIDPAFTNSGRLWRDVRDHDFTGSVSIGVPFHVAGQVQVLSGGVSIRSRYRVLHSDLLLTNGPGYFSLADLLAPDRYFPGGLQVSNYFINGKSAFAGGNSGYLDATNRGNYIASANLGAAYIMLEDHLTDQLFLHWGLRLESNSQLVSSSQYTYYSGFRDPRITTLDENTRVSHTDLLPSVTLAFQPLAGLQLHTSWFKTINRPELQELVPYKYYEADAFLVRTGNSLLGNTSIDNYDAGVDWMPAAGATLSVAGFYKKMDQPIENILSPYAGPCHPVKYAQ